MKSTQARFVSAALFFAFILICVAMFPIDRAFAQSANGPVIFDVRRSLPLEPDEPVTKDFYINAGPESGLKKGVYISVVRAVPVHDPIKNQQQATLNIPVGKLQVIDVQRGITVARLQNELNDDERPTLEFEGVMIGDHVDLGSATMDVPKKSKPRAKRQVAQTEEVAVTLVPAVLPAEPAPATGIGSAVAAAQAAAAPTAQAPASIPAAGPNAAAKPVSAPVAPASVAPPTSPTGASNAAPVAAPAVKTSQPPQSA